jgi:hypothetical protein
MLSDLQGGSIIQVYQLSEDVFTSTGNTVSTLSKTWPLEIMELL